jgi:hypothetical protein
MHADSTLVQVHAFFHTKMIMSIGCSGVQISEGLLYKKIALHHTHEVV